MIGVPFYLDHISGVVLVQSYREVVYTEKDKDLLVYVAQHIGDALGRKKSMDDMRNVNEVFSLFMRYSPVYVFIKEVTESHNRVLQASENFAEMIGIPGSQMIGKSMTDLFSIDFARIFLDPDHKSGKFLTEAEKASKRAAELAQQLLTFARGGEPNKKVVSVQQLVQEAVSLMLRGSNVRAIVDIPDAVHAVEADEGQLSQVLNNIIINASQAMPGGGKALH